MLTHLIELSLRGRLVVVLISVLLVSGGGWIASLMPVDVFPDLTAPTVTVLTEAHGLAPEEVEILVTFPIETALNGSAGVRRIRSSSGIGISVVWVEFEWGTDIYRARQIVSEKLQLTASQLPDDVDPPVLAPVSSIMGEIMFIGLTGDDATSPLDLRTTADWTIRRRILSIPGVSQVVPIGGGVRQFQVHVDPVKLSAFNLTLDAVKTAIGDASDNASAGFYTSGGKEYLIRGVGRIRSVDDLESSVIVVREGIPIKIRQIADVKFGPAIKRGEASVGGRPGVLMGILKQPEANTLDLTGRVDRALDEIEPVLPPGTTLHRSIFRQADFIEVAVDNVQRALLEGAGLVVVVLFVFLGSFRASIITLTAIPLSLIATTLVLKVLGGSINTMTLGGMTIAIGALVDDAIVDVENVVRRLRENAVLPVDKQRPRLDVILDATIEIRSSILFATLIVIVVFLPLFFLSGVEGRMLRPLGLTYVISLLASLFVALTLTPALCSYLIRVPSGGEEEGIVMRAMGNIYSTFLGLAIRLRWIVLLTSFVATMGTLLLFRNFGRSFLPPFNEGTLTISAVTLPGTALAESDRLAQRAEEIMLTLPEVKNTARRTGRAELDEHAQDVNVSEIDVSLEMQDRSKEEMLKDLRQRLAMVPGMIFNIGQPISHRIDHMLSGTRSAIAIKIFGPDLYRLRDVGQSVRSAIDGIPGMVDLAVEEQRDVPQLRIRYNREAMARFGITVRQLSHLLETMFKGTIVNKVYEEGRIFDVLVRLSMESIRSEDEISAALVDTPVGVKVPLKALASIRRDFGPNRVSREDVARKIVVSCNVSERALGDLIGDIQEHIASGVILPEGYYVVYGGQFEAEQEASRTISMLSLIALAAIFVLLYMAFGSMRLAVLTLLNLPLALIGGAFAIWYTDGILSIASIVGFITLFGIATRNGILMIDRYQTLTAAGFGRREAVLQGSRERLAPVLMTALTTGLALVPLVLAGNATGNEIQSPLARVVLGGLTTSTLLTLFVAPALYMVFGEDPPGTSSTER